MTRLRIDNLAHVVTVDDEFTVLDDATIEIDDGVITALHGRPHGELLRHAEDVTSRSNSRATSNRVRDAEPVSSRSNNRATSHRVRDAEDVVVVDGRGKLALPGLVNLHTHLPMTLLRGLAENVDLQGFLRIVWAAEGAVMDHDTVRLGAELGAVESLLGGVTTTLDMYFHHEAAHEGASAAGLRHVIGPVFFDGPGPDGLAWEERIAGLQAWPGRLHAMGGPTVPAAAMPHSTYTCSPEHLAEIAEVVAAWDAVRRLVHVHASENAAENDAVVARHGASPTQVLAAAGLLDGTAVLGHGVHLDATDIAMATGHGGVAVAHCPGSNLKLASGALPWQAYAAAGLRCGLGTDGCASSNDLDLWQVMRLAALLARLTSGDATAALAVDIVRAATIEGARALGMDDLIGSIEVGKRADLILLDLEQPHLTPVHDIAALLVFAAGRGDVTDAFVDGRQVVQDRRSTLIDTCDLLERARERGLVAAKAARDT